MIFKFANRISRAEKSNACKKKMCSKIATVVVLFCFAFAGPGVYFLVLDNSRTCILSGKDYPVFLALYSTIASLLLYCCLNFFTLDFANIVFALLLLNRKRNTNEISRSDTSKRELEKILNRS